MTKKEQENELEEENQELEAEESADKIEETGIESDLEQAEQGFQEKSFKDFFKPIQQTIQRPEASLEALPTPEPEFSEMAQQSQGQIPGISPDEEKSAMNYDIQPLKLGTKEEYHVQKPQETGGMVSPMSAGRVDFENIGRERIRVGSDFDFGEFQTRTMRQIGMSSSAKGDYQQPLEIEEGFNPETSTVMDNQPGFKSRKDYKTR